MKIIIASYFFALSSFSQALTNQTPWQRLTIPTAQCANGENYNLFLRKGKSDKVVFAFEEGGVCWSYSSCLGLLSRTNLKPVEKLDLSEGIFELTRESSSVHDYTFVFFPYCTGDVYMGKHVADYKGSTVKHVGKLTIENSLAYLVNKGHLALSNAQRVIFTGFSAGAIGSLYHVKTVDSYLPSYTHRSVVSDSPGLHFGKNFWNKFTPEQIKDFGDAFRDVGIDFDPKDGLMSKRVPGYCSQFPHWNIGIMQSTHDWVMSLVFGNITPAGHFEQVKGPHGIGQVTQNIRNCSSWVPSSKKHMFLNSAGGARQMAGPVTALGYFNEVANADVQKDKIPNYQGYSLWSYMFYPFQEN